MTKKSRAEEQAHKIKLHAQRQLHRILKKFKTDTERRYYKEESNHEIELLLATYREQGDTAFADKARETVHSLLVRLNSRQMEAIRLVYFEGKTLEASAKTMGVYKSVVCYHIKNALKRMSLKKWSEEENEEAEEDLCA